MSGPAVAGTTQILPQATTKLKQTQPLGVLPPPTVPASVAVTAEAEVAEEEASDTVNIVLAALIMLTTIFLGLVEYSKSRVADVKDPDITAVSSQSSWTELMDK